MSKKQHVRVSQHVSQNRSEAPLQNTTLCGAKSMITVGGKKRADWAQAPDNNNVQVVEERIPPVLQAAKAGSVQAVEWFMSDAPLRRYKEFAGINQHDKRIRALEESGNGFDKTIRTWLSAKSKPPPLLR